jgi:hypothetical protein
MEPDSMTSFLDRFKKKSPAPTVTPSFLVESTAVSQSTAPPTFLVQTPGPPPTYTAPTPAPQPAAPERLRFTVSKPHSPRQIRPLRKLAYILILLNVAVSLFFTSNNLQFNVALYAYMGISTILMAHYLSLSK